MEPNKEAYPIIANDLQKAKEVATAVSAQADAMIEEDRNRLLAIEQIEGGNTTMRINVAFRRRFREIFAAYPGAGELSAQESAIQEAVLARDEYEESHAATLAIIKRTKEAHKKVQELENAVFLNDLFNSRFRFTPLAVLARNTLCKSDGDASRA